MTKAWTIGEWYELLDPLEADLRQAGANASPVDSPPGLER